MTYAFGEVVLVPFPFTDQSGLKKRPAVVVSSSGYNANRRDLIIMAITSQVRQPPGFGEALVADWQAAGLIKSSVLKAGVHDHRTETRRANDGDALGQRSAHAQGDGRAGHQLNQLSIASPAFRFFKLSLALQ